MTLSIIVPVYKVRDYLRPCVESLLRQELTDAEILLVDDGSPDECGAMCDELAQQHPCIHALHRPNGGLSAARNTGIEAATGQYLTFVDSDDAVAPGTYAPLLALLHNDRSIDLLEYPVCRRCGTPGEALWLGEEVDIEQPDADLPFARTPLFEHWLSHRGYLHAYAWNKIYRRDLFATLRYPEGRYYEDALTILPLLQQVRHYHFAPLGAYLYYDRPGAISQSYDTRKVNDFLQGNLLMQRAMQSARPELRPYQMEHLCTVVNTLIDLLDTGVAAADPTLQPLWHEIDARRTSIGEMMRLPMPLSARLKGVLWTTLGTRRHCNLCHRLHRWLRKS
jgi:glycosyltransferase involved in cell wall biosynthesis